MADTGDPAPPDQAAQGPPAVLAPGAREFMCVVSVRKPCTNPPFKYLGLLDGCHRGIHVTEEELLCPQVTIYKRMADAIKTYQKVTPLEGEEQAAPCSMCTVPILPSATTPVLYMENCFHHFHEGCLYLWQDQRSSSDGSCLLCSVKSYRALLWPALFSTAADKNELFQLQKTNLGLNVSRNGFIQVTSSVENGFSAYQLYSNKKSITVQKRPSPPPPRPPRPPPPPPPKKIRMPKEVVVRKTIQIPRADLVETEEEKRKREERDRKILLFQLNCYICPQERYECPGKRACEFYHGWTGRAPSKTQKLPHEVRQFPEFYCVASALSPLKMPHKRKRFECTEQIRVHPQELVRCLFGFHLIGEDLSSVNVFADKMAAQIMAQMVVPEHSLDCAKCQNVDDGPEPPNSVRLHLEKCAHWLHEDCLPEVRVADAINPDRTLYLQCPSCKVTSTRVLAWPGPFQSDMLKKAIFKRQLENFKLNIEADMNLAITEVRNQENAFTLDIGRPNMISLDFSSESLMPNQKVVIYYD